MDEARALLAASRALLDRVESFIDQLGQDATGMAYARPLDQPEAAALPPEVAGYPHNSRRRFL
jgi:hypothetical protein